MGVPLAVGCLVAAVLCYGASSLLLSQGSHRVRGTTYLTGLGFQGAAFLLSFVARVELPLVLVQACVAASVAVTAVAGAALGRWRLSGGDGLALAGVVLGIAAVGGSAQASRVSLDGALPLIVAAVVGFGSLAGLGFRLGATALGALAGLAYGSSAIAARALAGDPLAAVRSAIGVLAAVLLVAGLAAGQVLLTVAFRRGAGSRSRSVTGPVAAMYVAATIWPALAGLVWLDDRLHDGRWPLAAVGVVLALVGTGALARHEAPVPVETAGPTGRGAGT